MRYSKVKLLPDAMRTVLRPFEPGDIGGHSSGQSRAQRITDRVLALPDVEFERRYKQMLSSLRPRHPDVEDTLQRRFDAVRKTLINCHGATGGRALMIGAYFMEEFSFESAALFNPSIVVHPVQTGVARGDLRFLLSLRAIGEGHVSSLTFRSGVWRRNGQVRVDKVGKYAVGPEVLSDGKLDEEGVVHLQCSGARHLSESVIFPFMPSQGRGIEDVRLVSFTDDAGVTDYRGTFTAFDGTEVRQMLLRTPDFRSIEMRTIEGPWAQGKGMALFPRLVGGKYMMLARQDNENIWLLTSDSPNRWTEAKLLLEPLYAWEFVQLGNCGSPIEIDEGWLVLTHGVGDVRTYSIGACLLDRNDPSKVLARTPEPIIVPEADERAGYVPNVVYSCGALLRDRTILIPFGVADNFGAFGTMSVDSLLRAMN